MMAMMVIAMVMVMVIMMVWYDGDDGHGVPKWAVWPLNIKSPHEKNGNSDKVNVMQPHNVGGHSACPHVAQRGSGLLS